MSYGFLSNRVKRRDQSGITSDRYEFLGLDQAEPDLGDPLIGPSSVSANPFTGDVSNLYFVASDGSGNRYWTKQTDVVAGGVITPGSITVRDEGVVVGGVNQVTDINFVGSGVTITSPASWVGAGSSSVDIQIAVTDVTGDGNVGNIQYKGSSGFIQGSDDLFYDASAQRLGLGTAIPTQKLDVKGNVAVSGILTANSITANSFTVDNFRINDEVLQFIVTSDAVGIGTTQPIATLDVRGTANISGIATIATVSTPQLSATNANISGVTTTGSLNIGTNEVISSARQLKNIASLDAVTTATIESAIAAAPNTFNDLNVTGIGTIQSLRSPAASFTGVTTAANLNVTGIATIGVASITSLGVTTITSGFSTSINSWVSGVSTISTADINVGIVSRVQATSIGIGTTNPRQELDVIGDIRLSGAIYDFNGSSGTSGQVLISNGTSPVVWGSPGSIVAGSATSVTTLDKNGINTDYYPTFVELTTGNQSIFLDSSGIKYNPSTNTLTVDKIKTSDLEVEGINRYTTGVVTTTSKNEAVIDSLNTTLYRSARYNIQVNTLGQLTLYQQGSSVSGLSSGRNYFPGTYTDINLTNVVGSGTDAKATITVSPEANLTIVGSLNGTFTTSGSTVGIATSQSVIFSSTVLPSNYENSRVTNVTITNSGTGYTSVPTLTFDSPIISGNPVEGVGVGSTARAVVSSMKVTDFLFANSGFVTSLVPTVTIDAPISGTQATANVGYGISTITVTDAGVGYLSIPSVSFSSGSAVAGVSSVIVNKIRVTNPGYGYTTGDLNTTFVFSSGSASATNNSFSLPNSHLGFTITNSGLGYTAPPRLTVSAPQIGINTGIATCTLGIATFTVTSPGSGYTVSPTISNSPTVIGFAATVGLGISSYAIQISGGVNYTGAPLITFNPVGGIGTGAQGSFTSINGDTGALENFTITNPGFGYTVPPTVTISGGGGTGAGVTIRSMVVTNVSVTNTGYGASSVVASTVVGTPSEYLDLVVTRTGTVGFGTTSSVSNVVFSTQGTLGTASTTIITGISTFDTVIRQKTGDLNAVNDTTISGIDTSNVSVGFAVTGTFVQAGTAVSFVSDADGGTIGLTTNLTNSSVGFGLTFYIADTLSQRVIVGQGVSGTSINLTESGTTVVSIGSSTVTLSRAATNSGVQTSTFSFGTLVTTPAVFQTTVITGITTTNILSGQRVIGTGIQTGTNVSSVGVGSITIDKITTNVGISTTSFSFYTVVPIGSSGATVTPSMGIGRVTVGISTLNPLNLGFGTGYTALPGIAVTAIDGITGGGGIVTTASFGIDTDCIRVTNPGIYTSIPSVLINSPGIGGGSAATANVGIGVSTIRVTSQGSYTGTKPTISFPTGSPLVSAAATVTNIILNGSITVVNAGSGYTSADFPVDATFSNVSLGATVNFGVDNITLTSAGLGYTVTPTITITDSTYGTRATATATLANYDSSFSLQPGPGYGNTFVYYIKPTASNTFELYRNVTLTDKINLGFSTSGSPAARVGGKITDVSISNAGSGYTGGNILSASAVSLGNTYSANVGTGFSFTVSNVVQNYQISDIIMLQSVGSASTSVDIIEYAGISNLDDLVSFTTDISGTNARLKVTPKYRDNVIKITRTSITN